MYLKSIKNSIRNILGHKAISQVRNFGKQKFDKIFDNLIKPPSDAIKPIIMNTVQKIRSI